MLVLGTADGMSIIDTSCSELRVAAREKAEA
jgi:hypothetical protein